MSNQATLTCVVCGSAESELFCRKDDMSYRVCRSCQHVFVEAAASREEVAAAYRSRDSHHSSDLKEKWDYSPIKDDMVYGPLLDKIGKLTRPGRLLDIGCSNGSFVYAANRRGWGGCGIELETGSFNLARTHGVEVYNKELAEKAFPENHFSAVTMWQVIEHLKDPGEMLAEIYRVLKPGGVLAVSTPNRRSIGWLLNGVRWQPVEPEVHFHLFDPRGLKDLHDRYGFAVKAIETADIKPSTVREFFRIVFRSRCVERTNSMEEYVNSGSEGKMRFLFMIRRLINVPLKLTRSGEDIYGYFAKPGGDG